MTGSRTLTRDQKRELVLGWFNWPGAAAINVAVVLLSLMWVSAVVFAGNAIPDRILTVPILVAFVVSLTHIVVLNRLRGSMTPRQMIGSVLAAMSMQWTLARAAASSIWKDSPPSPQTAQGWRTRQGPGFPAFWEAVIAGLLLIGAVLVIITNSMRVHEAYIFALVLVVQSLPFLAACALASVEGLRINTFGS